MALLAVDIGNAATVLGLLDPLDAGASGASAVGREVVANWRVGTDERRTGDEWAVLLRGLLGSRLADVDGVVLCSTVPSVLNAWRDMLARHWADVAQVVVEPGVRTGVPVAVDNPREVGTDRIANAVAAATLFDAPTIVVDFGGTATTYDVIDATGRYIGGAITPGIEISLDALSRAGAQLRMVELARPRTVIGKNTVEALQSGVLFGVASQVEGMVGRIVEALGAGGAGDAGGVVPDRVAVVATGYLAPLVVGECRCFTDHAPWLTLQGLAMIFERNRR